VIEKVRTRELSQVEFRETFGEPMRRLQDAEPPFDFWKYFDAIPADDFGSHDCSDGRVGWVYREPSGRFEHVLVSSEDRNVFMVLVLDLKAQVVHGHRLMDLNKEYGLA
jgi:hypothetical protein